MTLNMLALRDIVKIFNPGTQDEKRALDGLSLVVTEGEFITIIGSNGAGKSTLLNVVAGTFPPDEGAIHLDGADVTSDPDYARAGHLARVFQDPTMGTAASMTIEENLCLAELRGKRRGLKWGVTGFRRERYRDMLKVLELGLEDRLKDILDVIFVIFSRKMSLQEFHKNTKDAKAVTLVRAAIVSK